MSEEYAGFEDNECMKCGARVTDEYFCLDCWLEEDFPLEEDDEEIL